MDEGGAYGSGLGRAFRMPDAPVLKTSTLNKRQLAVTQIRFDGDKFGATDPIPREDAYLVALQVGECLDHRLFVDEREVPVVPIRPGVTMIYDLRQSPVASMETPFHSLHFYLPRQTIVDVAEELGTSPFDELRFTHGVQMEDPVVRNLVMSLVPLMGKPEEASALFTSHVAMALHVHVAQTYGGLQIAPRKVLGGLAPWQERRAKEYIFANLDGEVSIQDLARECGLSPGHFARAFRQSNGTSPYRWLQQRRIEQAKRLLLKPELTLSEIGLACGFADQSHFTRVFTRFVGMSPGAFRRSHSSSRQS